MRRILPLLWAVAACSNAIDVRSAVGFEAQVVVSSPAGTVGDQVTVTVRVINLNEDAVTLKFPSSCVFAYAILDLNDELIAPSNPCGDDTPTHTFPVGISEQSFTFTIGDATHPLTSGTYEVYGGVGFPLVIVSDPVTLQISNLELSHVP